MFNRSAVGCHNINNNATAFTFLITPLPPLYIGISSGF
jgi:hypothetical protein